MNKGNVKRKVNEKRKKPRGVRGNRSRSGIDRSAALVRAYGRVQQNAMNFLPPWLEAPMRYADKFNLTIAAGGFADYILRANSIFDPDRTGVGHAPLGYSQLAGVYNRYRVDKLEWYIDMPSVSLTFSACVVLVNGVKNLTAIGIAEEWPTARFRSVGFNGSPPGVFTGHKKLAVFNGRSEDNYNIDDQTGAVINANPLEVIDLHIFIENPNALPITVQLNFSLKYRTVFYDPTTPLPSIAPPMEVSFMRQPPVKVDLNTFKRVLGRSSSD